MGGRRGVVELWDHLLLTPPPLPLSHPHALGERKGERQLQSPPLSQVCSPSLPPSLSLFLRVGGEEDACVSGNTTVLLLLFARACVCVRLPVCEKRRPKKKIKKSQCERQR